MPSAGRPRFAVSIPYSSPSGDQGHTIYSIDVIEDTLGIAYTCGRRFSEFDALRERLALEADETPLTSAFPPKKWFWNMEPGLVEERRQQLEVWLQEAFALLLAASSDAAAGVAGAAAPTAGPEQNEELESQLLEFIEAAAHLAQVEAERRAAKLRRAWARLQVPATRGPTTRLHVLASGGQAELLRNALKELRGGHDWLPTPSNSHYQHHLTQQGQGPGGSAPAPAPAAVVTAYDPKEEDRIVGLLGPASNPAESSVLLTEDGEGTRETLPLPGERLLEDNGSHSHSAVDSSTEVEVVVGAAAGVIANVHVAHGEPTNLHAVLAQALGQQRAPQQEGQQARAARPLGTLDGGDASGRTAFHLACGAGHRECVRALVLAGCRTELVDEKGLTGWDWAAAPPTQSSVVRELAGLAKHQQRDQGEGQQRTALVMESRVHELNQQRPPSAKGQARGGKGKQKARSSKQQKQRASGSGSESRRRAGSAVI